MKVEVAVLGSLSLTVIMVSVDVKATLNSNRRLYSLDVQEVLVS